MVTPSVGHRSLYFTRWRKLWSFSIWRRHTSGLDPLMKWPWKEHPSSSPKKGHPFMDLKRVFPLSHSHDLGKSLSPRLWMVDLVLFGLINGKFPIKWIHTLYLFTSTLKMEAARFHQYTGIHLQDYTVSQPRRLESYPSSLWKPQFLQ